MDCGVVDGGWVDGEGFSFLVCRHDTQPTMHILYSISLHGWNIPGACVNTVHIPAMQRLQQTPVRLLISSSHSTTLAKMLVSAVW
jgi:hypothetical protein